MDLQVLKQGVPPAVHEPASPVVLCVTADSMASLQHNELDVE